MMAIEKGVWRGYWPLFLTFVAAQLTQQVDMLTVGRLGGIAPSAYFMLTRTTVFDLILLASMGAVASTAVSSARREGDHAEVVARVLGIALLAGLFCCAFGLWLYPNAARWIAGDGALTTLVRSAIFWFSLAAPFRFFNSAAVFVLHAMGRGNLVVRWKLSEMTMKVVVNFLMMDVFGLGFSGCFVSGLIIQIVSSLWCSRILLPDRTRWPAILMSVRSWEFLRSTGWEAQRLIGSQVAALTCFALFSARWLGIYDDARVSCFAVGQALMMIVIAPFIAMTRHLAIRLGVLTDERLALFLKTIWLHGMSLAVGGAILLFLSDDWLGHIYRQQGRWWSAFIHALALSLPIRFAANVIRGCLQSKGAFAIIATGDTAAVWLIAVPLIIAGLYFDSPLVTYLSLIIPEMAIGAWLWSRLSSPRRAGLPSAGHPPLRPRVRPLERIICWTRRVRSAGGTGGVRDAPCPASHRSDDGRQFSATDMTFVRRQSLLVLARGRRARPGGRQDLEAQR